MCVVRVIKLENYFQNNLSSFILLGPAPVQGFEENWAAIIDFPSISNLC